MTLLIRHIASGQAFFTGVAILILAASLGTRWKRTATVCCGIGLLLVCVSATPLHPVYFGLSVLVSLTWLTAIRRAKSAPPSEDADREEVTNPPPAKNWRPVTVAFAGIWIAGAGMELPYHITPNVPRAAPRLTIFADSVTAGMGERDAVTWPQLFAEAHDVEVIDHSRMGATAASATLLAEQHPPEPGIVLLEIGGNDVLGSTSRAEFERTLEELLERVTGLDRVVVMLELPLPPFYNGYGRIQRRLATELGVALVPKRFLLNILLSESTTLDTIHLNQQGHQQMADSVWELLDESFATD